VRVKILVSVGAMLEIVDKSIMLDQIMPRVFQIENNEPGVLMAILGRLQCFSYICIWYTKLRRIARNF